jgi:hypothetical protein
LGALQGVVVCEQKCFRINHANGGEASHKHIVPSCCRVALYNRELRDRTSRFVHRFNSNRADSTGRRNTFDRDVGWPAVRIEKLTGRGAMRSQGAASLRSQIERLFWEQIATGITIEKTADAVGEYKRYVSELIARVWIKR